jgi:3-oxoacyl-[acyl-carrier protein] reductase
MDLKNKVALITGSSVGVGRAVARLLAAKGCRVVINCNRSLSDAEEAARLCRAAGAEAIVVQADVSKDAECRRLIQAAVDKFSGIDVLVNNAAVTEFIPFEDLEGLSEQKWERIFRTNVYGAFFCARAAVPHMKRAGRGAIVNVASIAGIEGNGSSIAYAASKAALINMTLALARTLGPEIRVNAVAPGAIDTRWIKNGLGESGFQSLREKYRSTAPLRDIVAPEVVAEAIVWLIEGAAMTTGEIITVDSGVHL